MKPPEQIEMVDVENDAYECAKLQAIALLGHGFHLGGAISGSRDEWHER